MPLARMKRGIVGFSCTRARVQKHTQARTVLKEETQAIQMPFVFLIKLILNEINFFFTKVLFKGN